jgi:spoIIIJ-associated protein
MEKIFIAKSVDEAKEAAAAEFGVDISKITFNIIEEPKKGLFGKTKGEAKVSAFYKETKVDIAKAYIKKILAEMDICDVDFDVTENEDSALIEIKSADSDAFVGKKGEVLDSIQYLTSLVCNKGDKEYFRISLDTNGYREKRKAQLEALAEKISKNVLKNGRASALEPMNPYERRIIHAKVAEIEGVSSHSTGQDPYRKVIISSNVKRPERKGGNFKGRNRKTSKPKEFDIMTSFEKDYKKPRPEDSLGSGLYSKIEF